MSPILLALALLALALNAPPGALLPEVDAVQYLHRGPADAIDLAPGESAVVPLEKGTHGGLDLLASNGILTPRCAVVVAAAQVIADGPVTVALDRGVHLRHWDPVIEGGPILPMTAVPLLVGQSLRLRITNRGPNRARVTPTGTRLSVYGANCDGGGGGQLVRP